MDSTRSLSIRTAGKQVFFFSFDVFAFSSATRTTKCDDLRVHSQTIRARIPPILGDIDHLCTSFLIADSINHGVTLRKSPGLQYLVSSSTTTK